MSIFESYPTDPRRWKAAVEIIGTIHGYVYHVVKGGLKAYFYRIAMTITSKLEDFTTESGMPWLQYYDGKFWKNDISTRLDIASIPAMFLLDQEGRVVTTSARGPKLETDLERPLKL